MSEEMKSNLIFALMEDENFITTLHNFRNTRVLKALHLLEQAFLLARDFIYREEGEDLLQLIEQNKPDPNEYTSQEQYAEAYRKWEDIMKALRALGFSSIKGKISDMEDFLRIYTAFMKTVNYMNSLRGFRINLLTTQRQQWIGEPNKKSWLSALLTEHKE